MRKVDNGKKKKRKRKENNYVFSGHYVIASSLPPERRPLDRRKLEPKMAALFFVNNFDNIRYIFGVYPVFRYIFYGNNRSKFAFYPSHQKIFSKLSATGLSIVTFP